MTNLGKPQGNMGISEQLDTSERDIVLATKRLFEIYPSDNFDIQMIIVGNFVYLTESGAMTRDEYYEMFQRCAASGNFSELGIFMRQTLISQAQAYLDATPDLPEQGNGTTPGKAQIRSGMMMNSQGIKAIEDIRDDGGVLAVEHITVPPLREKALLMMNLQENGQSMQEVYESLG